jgi:anti-sigma factor ChrR (cupin superfamily)
MITERQQELASLYALGALSPSEHAAFKEELSGNPELLALTRSLQSAIALVAVASPIVVPPPGLKDKVLRRIENLETPVAPVAIQAATLPGLSFALAATESGWKPLPIPGASVKLLTVAPENNYAVLLGKLEAGASYPPHFHKGPENFYILKGDLNIGPHRLVAGDFHHADAGSTHEENYSVTGCILIAVVSATDPLVALAKA